MEAKQYLQLYIRLKNKIVEDYTNKVQTDISEKEFWKQNITRKDETIGSDESGTPRIKKHLAYALFEIKGDTYFSDRYDWALNGTKFTVKPSYLRPVLVYILDNTKPVISMNELWALFKKRFPKDAPVSESPKQKINQEIPHALKVIDTKKIPPEALAAIQQFSQAMIDEKFDEAWTFFHKNSSADVAGRWVADTDFKRTFFKSNGFSNAKLVDAIYISPTKCIFEVLYTEDIDAITHSDVGPLLETKIKKFDSVVEKLKAIQEYLQTFEFFNGMDVKMRDVFDPLFIGRLVYRAGLSDKEERKKFPERKPVSIIRLCQFHMKEIDDQWKITKLDFPKLYPGRPEKEK